MRNIKDKLLVITTFGFLIAITVVIGFKLYHAYLVDRASVLLGRYGYAAEINGEKLSPFDTMFLSMSEIGNYSISIDETNKIVKLNLD